MSIRSLSILVVCGFLAIYGFNLLGQESAPKKAPAVFKAKFETTKGDFIIEVHRDWAARGADRFYELVSSGFYDDCKFFRVMKGFMVQFGIHGDPKVAAKWLKATIKDDIVVKSNKRGFVTYAKAGPNSRTTQVFINYADKNKTLDSQGFAPFGEVIEGMEVVDSLYSKYDNEPSDHQEQIQKQGNAFLNANYPKLDGITKATILEE
jgi:peptidyl-prolyl cis-trans isomerase A (cyclophilin A)